MLPSDCSIVRPYVLHLKTSGRVGKRLAGAAAFVAGNRRRRPPRSPRAASPAGDQVGQIGVGRPMNRRPQGLNGLPQQLGGHED